MSSNRSSAAALQRARANDIPFISRQRAGREDQAAVSTRLILQQARAERLVGELLLLAPHPHPQKQVHGPPQQLLQLAPRSQPRCAHHGAAAAHHNLSFVFFLGRRELGGERRMSAL